MFELAEILPEPPYPNVWYESEKGEHYRLLNSVCEGKDLVFDVGTYQGYSSIAMSSAKQVVSYDVANHRLWDKYEGVEYCVGDVLKDKRLIKSQVILLDTYHTGEFENIFYRHLCEIEWKGLLILDDIHLNDQMSAFWDSIHHKKQDATEYGHYTGTGLVWMKS